MKYLVVGLGNIGAEYADTRHNIGFKVLDCLAEQSNIAFTTGRYGATAELRYKGRTLVLLKPSTYMNLSGKAVRYWMEAEKIAPENLLVVVDDIALPFGTLRMRPKGSAGGHNGLKNITELLGTEAYARIRFGIGGDFARGHQVDYVLGSWSDEERKALPERLKVFAEAVLSFVSILVVIRKNPRLARSRGFLFSETDATVPAPNAAWRQWPEAYPNRPRSIRGPT